MGNLWYSALWSLIKLHIHALILHFGMWLQRKHYTCPDKLILGDIKIQSYFLLSFLNTKMAQVVEILPNGRQGSIDSANLIYFDELVGARDQDVNSHCINLVPDIKCRNGKKLYQCLALYIYYNTDYPPVKHLFHILKWDYHLVLKHAR